MPAVVLIAPTPIAAAPDAPDKNDRSTFNLRAYNWAAWQKDHLQPEGNALAQNVYDNATLAYSYSQTAQAAANTASNANTAAGTSTTNYTPVLNAAASLVYVEANRTPTVGMRMRVASSAAPATNYAAGVVTAWNAGTKTITIQVDRIGPAPAAAAAWQIFAEGSPGLDGASATLTTPVRAVAANGNITSADNGYAIKTTAAGVTLTCDTPAALSGCTVYFLRNSNGVLLSGTFADGSTLKAVPRDCAGILNSDGTSLYLDIIPPIAIPQVVKDADYTLQLVDQGCELLHNNTDGSTRTWTIPANAAVPFPIGTVLTFTNKPGAPNVTIAIATDTLYLAGPGTAGNRTLAAGGMATAKKISATQWFISGPGLT